MEKLSGVQQNKMLTIFEIQIEVLSGDCKRKASTVFFRLEIKIFSKFKALGSRTEIPINYLPKMAE